MSNCIVSCTLYWRLCFKFHRKLPQLSDDERDILIGQLSSLKFIKDQSDGELHTASDYYDAENRLFQLMLDKSDFPPEPFDNYRWVGLQS